MLLLVDSVNALYDTFAEMFRGDFSFTSNPSRLKMLSILGVFTAGSAIGLVTLSHLLNFVLKHYKNITTATIMGFIAGSLGVVWPWKRTMYKTDDAGAFLLDSSGERIIENYQRYFPEISSSETWVALLFVIIGVFIVLALDLYGKRTRKVK